MSVSPNFGQNSNRSSCSNRNTSSALFFCENSVVLYIFSFKKLLQKVVLKEDGVNETVGIFFVLFF